MREHAVRARAQTPETLVPVDALTRQGHALTRGLTGREQSDHAAAKSSTSGACYHDAVTTFLKWGTRVKVSVCNLSAAKIAASHGLVIGLTRGLPPEAGDRSIRPALRAIFSGARWFRS
jgi:hypothetical protein